MNKQELVELMLMRGRHTGISSKVEAERALGATLDALFHALAAGNVSMVGFGSFRQSVRKERTGVNPSNGQKLTIKASKTVRFTAGKALKEFVAGQRAWFGKVDQPTAE